MSTVTASQVKDLRERTGLGMMSCKKALGETDGDMEKAIEYLRKQGALVAAKRSGRDAKEGKVLLVKTSTAACAVEINCESDFVSASDDFNNYASTVVEAIKEHQPENLDALKALEINGKSIADANTEIAAKIGENIGISRYVKEDIGPNDYPEVYSHMGGKIGVIVKLSADGPIEVSEELTTLGKDLAMQVAATNPLALDSNGISEDILSKEKEIYHDLAVKEGKPADFIDKIVEGKLGKFFKDNCLNKQIFVKDSKLSIEKLLENSSKSLNLKNLKLSGFQRLQLGQ